MKIRFIVLSLIALLFFGCSGSGSGDSYDSYDSYDADDAADDVDTLQELVPAIEASLSLAVVPSSSTATSLSKTIYPAIVPADFSATPGELYTDFYSSSLGYARYPASGFIEDFYLEEGNRAFVELRQSTDGWGDYQVSLYVYPSLSPVVEYVREQYRVDAGSWYYIVDPDTGESNPIAYEDYRSIYYDGAIEHRTVEWTRYVDGFVYVLDYYAMPDDYSDAAYTYPDPILEPDKIAAQLEEYASRTTYNVYSSPDCETLGGDSTGSAAGCTSGADDTCKIENDDIGVDGITVDANGVLITITSWIPKADSPGEYVGFTFESDPEADYIIKAGTDYFASTGFSWSHPNGDSGPEVSAISYIDFCPGGDSDVCVLARALDFCVATSGIEFYDELLNDINEKEKYSKYFNEATTMYDDGIQLDAREVTVWNVGADQYKRVKSKAVYSFLYSGQTSNFVATNDVNIHDDDGDGLTTYDSVYATEVTRRGWDDRTRQIYETEATLSLEETVADSNEYAGTLSIRKDNTTRSYGVTLDSANGVSITSGSGDSLLEYLYYPVTTLSVGKSSGSSDARTISAIINGHTFSGTYGSGILSGTLSGGGSTFNVAVTGAYSVID